MIIRRAINRVNAWHTKGRGRNIVDWIYFEKKFYWNAVHGKNGRTYEKQRLICSLTTIPKRIQFVKYPILSMLHQTVRPDRIVLYLGSELFKGVKLPEDLLALRSEGLIIRYVEDVRVHTKYYYAFQEYPDSLILTVDDDVVYDKRLIEALLLQHEEYPQAVVCSRAHRITFEADGKAKPYSQWEWEAKTKGEDMDLLATGVGGVLYAPALFHISPCQKELMLKLSPTADDLWLKAVEFANGIPVATIKGSHWLAGIPDTQEVSLNATNVHQNMNDLYWEKLSEHFGMSREALCAQIPPQTREKS